MSLLHQDRKHLDNRRVGAYLVDSLVLLPMGILAFRYEWGISVMAMGLGLVYFFLCEASTGQTVGKAVFRLRVVDVHGQIASPKAVAARTIIRAIEQVLIGAIAIATSGPKRQRLGDRAARTIVVDAREHDVSVPLSPSLHLVYPMVWLAPALVIFVLTAGGRMPGSYRYEVDEVCKSADAAIKAEPRAWLTVLQQEAAYLDQIQPPPHWKEPHATLVAEYTTMAREAPRIGDAAEINALVASANQRLADLGYRGCAGLES